MYCGNCKEEVESYKLICPKCGGRVKNDRKFCANCGVERKSLEEEKCEACGQEFQMVYSKKTDSKVKGTRNIKGFFNAISGALLFLGINIWVAYSDFFAKTGKQTKSGYESVMQRHFNVPIDLVFVVIAIFILVRAIITWRKEK